jgi:hypothetical protein
LSTTRASRSQSHRPAATAGDVTRPLPLPDKVPAVAGTVGRSRRRPDVLLAGRGRPHGSGLGTFRHVVERTIAWPHGFRRLRIRWERHDDSHEAFPGLATA